MKKTLMHSKHLALVIAFLFFFNTGLIISPPQKAQAAGTHYYVSPDGNDNNSGTQSSPFKTINKAISVVGPGDTVHVAPGVYEEYINITVSGTASQRIRFVSDVRWGAKLQNYDYKTLGIEGHYIDFEGFEITGNATHGVTIRGSHVRFIGNHVYGFAPLPSQDTSSGGAGIVTYNSQYSMTDIDIIGNVVHDIGITSSSSFIHGIYTAGYDIRVVNNIVYNCAGWGLHAWHAADKNVFANNLVYANRKGGIVVGAGDGPGGVVADEFIVANNIVIYNQGYAIVESGSTGLNNVYTNNLIFGNTNGILLKNGLVAQNTITDNPRLYRVATDGTGDFHLASISPAINAGINSVTAGTNSYTVPATDFDGFSRVYNGTVDIGPYEYVPRSMISNVTFEEFKQLGTEVPYWSKRDHVNFASLTTEKAYSGNYSVKIADTSSSLSCGLESNIFYPKPGDKIKASAKIYLVSGLAHMYIRYYNSSGSLIGYNYTEFTTPKNQWADISVSGTAPANTAYASVMVYSTIASTGTVYFDDIKAEWVLKNPSFEEGSSIPGWTKKFLTSGVSVTTEKVYSGSYAVKFVDNSTTSSCALDCDSIVAVPGETYTATTKAWISSGVASIYLYFYNASGTLLAFNHEAKSSPTGQWITLTATGTAPAGTKYLVVRLYSGDANLGTAYYDYVTLSRVGP